MFMLPKESNKNSIHLRSAVQQEVQELRRQILHARNSAEQEISRLNSELSKLGHQFRSAEQAYLPLWSLPYYDEAAKRAAMAKDQAILYYDQVCFNTRHFALWCVVDTRYMAW